MPSRQVDTKSSIDSDIAVFCSTAIAALLVASCDSLATDAGLTGVNVSLS